MRLVASILAAATAAPVSAQDVAPDYYVEAIFAVTTAERLAEFCAPATVNLARSHDMSEALLTRLRADGYDVRALQSLAGVEAGLTTLQARFMNEHGLAGADAATVCRAIEAEIAGQTAVGALMDMGAPVDAGAGVSQ